MNPSAFVGRLLDEIPTPAMVVDLELLERNLAAMEKLIGGTGLSYRPHVKTHKSIEIARRQLAAGAMGICCAKLGEAEVMAAGGIGDLHITTPVVDRARLRRLASLARSARVSVVADGLENVEMLSAAAVEAKATIEVLVEVDVGQNRCGVRSASAAVALSQRIAGSAGLTFRGLQGYNGSLQGVRTFAKREQAVRRSLEILLEAAECVRRQGFAVDTLTGGGTGSCAIDIKLGGLTELQPGSYVFMDTNYRAIEWSPEADAPPFALALTVHASVVSLADPGRAIVDAGWKAISSDSGIPRAEAVDGVELKFEFAGDEHGVLIVDDANPLFPGRRVRLYPSHCDTTVNLYDQMYVVRDGVVVDVWKVDARGRSQ